MGRSPCCESKGVRRGQWTEEEDQILISHIQTHGHANWRALPRKAGLQRCGKSCRLRWVNYLRPDVKRGNFTREEEDAIIALHENLGNRWSAIAAHFPGRTDNEIKNIWNTHLRKRLVRSDNNEKNNNNNIATSNQVEGDHDHGLIVEDCNNDHTTSSTEMSSSPSDYSGVTGSQVCESMEQGFDYDPLEIDLDEFSSSFSSQAMESGVVEFDWGRSDSTLSSIEWEVEEEDMDFWRMMGQAGEALEF